MIISIMQVKSNQLLYLEGIQRNHYCNILINYNQLIYSNFKVDPRDLEQLDRDDMNDE
jgi:hypothetical protein